MGRWINKRVCFWLDEWVKNNQQRRAWMNWKMHRWMIKTWTGNSAPPDSRSSASVCVTEQRCTPAHPQSDPCRPGRLRGSARCPPPAAPSSVGTNRRKPAGQSMGPTELRPPCQGSYQTHRRMPQDPVDLRCVWHLKVKVSAGKPTGSRAV